MHLGPAHAHLEQGRAARDQVDRLPFTYDAAGLADHRRVRVQQPLLGEPACAERRARLLVGDEREDQRAPSAGRRPGAPRRPRSSPRRLPSCHRSRGRRARRPRSRDPTDRCAMRPGHRAASCRGGRRASTSGPHHRPAGRGGWGAPGAGPCSRTSVIPWAARRPRTTAATARSSPGRIHARRRHERTREARSARLHAPRDARAAPARSHARSGEGPHGVAQAGDPGLELPPARARERCARAPARPGRTPRPARPRPPIPTAARSVKSSDGSPAADTSTTM